MGTLMCFVFFFFFLPTFTRCVPVRSYMYRPRMKSNGLTEHCEVAT